MFKFSENELLEYATIEDVYKYCNHYDLFRHYIGDFKIGKPILSPLMSESNPSFAIFASGNNVFYKDFRLGGGDIINFVMQKFNLSTRDAINKIIFDAGLSNKFKTNYKAVNGNYSPIIKYNVEIQENKIELQIKKRKSNDSDINFWKQFGITRETLNKFKVTPISYIFLNGKGIKADNYAYAFIERKDDKVSYTIYQPYSKLYKWLKSHDASVFYGWSNLPQEGKNLILTKSFKDIMTIDSLTGIPATAMQSELIQPKKHIIEQLKSRFNNIYLFYDNDWDKEKNFGREFGSTIAKEFNLQQIEIPDEIAKLYKAKDISDLVKNGTPDFATNFLKSKVC